MRVDTCLFYFWKKYSKTRYEWMDILLSLNDLLIIDTHLLLWGDNTLSTVLLYFKENNSWHVSRGDNFSCYPLVQSISIILYWMLIKFTAYITFGFKTIQVRWIFEFVFRTPKNLNESNEFEFENHFLKSLQPRKDPYKEIKDNLQTVCNLKIFHFLWRLLITIVYIFRISFGFGMEVGYF